MGTRNWCVRPVSGKRRKRVVSPSYFATRQSVIAVFRISWCTIWCGRFGQSTVDNQRQIDGARLWLNPPQTCATLRLAGLTFFRAAAPDDVEHGSSGKKHHVQRVRFSRCNSNACENAACRRVKKAIGKMLHQPRHSLQTGWFVQHDQLRVFITISIPDGLLAVSLLAITEFQATVKKNVFAGPTTENRRWFVKA